MRRIFISYKRIEPDSTVAGELKDAFEADGHDVFIDRDMLGGEVWAQTIEAKVRGADFFIVLLSAAAVRSEYVAGEIEAALDQRSKSQRPIILPVRLDFADHLPYPLNQRLGQFNQLSWNAEADANRVLVQDLRDSMEGRRATRSQAPEPTASTTTVRAPAPSAPNFPAGGATATDDRLYVERASDRIALAAVQQAGQTVSIRGPRQSGKSSLLIRLVSRAVEHGKKVVAVDLQEFDSRTVADTGALLKELMRQSCRQLGLPPVPIDDWQSSPSPTLNCSSVMEDRILSETSGQVLLAVDEADRIVSSAARRDFFGLLRSWHEKRANPIARSRWSRLDIILAISSEPMLLVEDAVQSPFNVSIPILLQPFSDEEAAEMNHLAGSPLSPHDVTNLNRFVGGHPYLLRLALHAVTTTAIQTILNAQNSEDGPFADHLRRLRFKLSADPDLGQAARQVIRTGALADPILLDRLKAVGLVASVGDHVSPTCGLYAKFLKGWAEGR